jgi:hypothetical protein
MERSSVTLPGMINIQPHRIPLADIAEIMRVSDFTYKSSMVTAFLNLAVRNHKERQACLYPDKMSPQQRKDMQVQLNVEYLQKHNYPGY